MKVTEIKFKMYFSSQTFFIEKKEDTAIRNKQ